MIYVVYQDELTEKIYFELDDNRLSATFDNALTTRCESYLPSTWNGCFDLTLTPLSTKPQSDDWLINVEIGSWYFKGRENYATSFQMTVTTQAMMDAVADLKKEEQQIYRKNLPH